MPTFTGKTFASFYKNILGINQSTNAGVATSLKEVQDGKGSNTVLSLSDDQLLVKPQNDDTTTVLDVKSSGGSSVLTVDGTNKRVLCGSSQVNALTQYRTFSGFSMTPSGAGAHMVLGGASVDFASTGLPEVTLGTGTDPATTLDVSAEAAESHGLVQLYWYLPDAITIMSASVLMGGNNATDSILNFHLMSYAMDTSSNYGDLSDGTVIADSGTTSAVDEDVIKLVAMTNLPTDVAAGRIILATVESSATLIVSAQMTVKYHIQ